jgi:hypothetical protein
MPRCLPPHLIAIRNHEHVNASPNTWYDCSGQRLLRGSKGILSEDSRKIGGGAWEGQNGHRNFLTCCAAQEQYGCGTAINGPGRYASYDSQGVGVANKDCMSCCFGMINYRSDYRTGIQ